MSTSNKAKTVYFIAGLPRSGSTLLTNILAQNPACYTTAWKSIESMAQFWKGYK